MTRIDLEIYDDVVSTLNKIRDINDTGIEVQLPEGSILFENIVNLKLIKKHADKYGITVHFDTSDENGANLISMLEEGTLASSMADTFKDIEESIGERQSSSRRQFKLPMLNLTAIKL